MGGVDVASVVASIVSAFGSGLDIFHRLRGKKRKSNARLPRPSEEEEWLKQSLENRPMEIKNEYDQSVAKFGHRFEVGDDLAHASLAHTLLVLNTGLINLINHALSGDSKTKVVSGKTLYNLSETAATDTLMALGQLNSRLSLARQLRLAGEAHPNWSDELTGHPKGHKPSSSSSSSRALSRPPPAPLLVRGGWVRSKSGSSVVSGAAARKLKEEQSQRHHRSKSDPNAPRTSKVKARKDGESDSDAGSRSSKRRGFPDEKPHRHSQRQASDQLRPQRQPGMLIVPSDLFDQYQTLNLERPPPRPPKIPLDPQPRTRQRRKEVRPVSTMTFMTASTKIGEIPETHLQSQSLPAEELGSRRVAYPVPSPLEDDQPRKRKGFKFWKREDKGRDTAVH
ncbi:hypothetical protein PV05_10053 [Exophiala xenobiotica]|uniref:Uncharacterized protein n=1 Tax=Exophiala xenobiotica TaxID=348802 RepID=A0A0D2E9H8_9EURO|nr:uncharacterized protein PV05_10053 [Exophiala xenobiotica]KIW51320.1 hypothetical protein PV05_10053 [Exophiala xenobiotica]